MKITDIELGMLRVPLKTPFKTALRTVETVEDIVVMVRTDTGNTGYGEAPATAVITDRAWQPIAEALSRPACSPAPPVGSVAAKIRTTGGGRATGGVIRLGREIQRNGDAEKTERSGIARPAREDRF